MKYMTVLVCVMVLLFIAGSSSGRSIQESGIPGALTDDRPPAEWQVHSIGNVVMGLVNAALWGDPWANYESMEWPAGLDSDYLFLGSLWSCCYGDITSGGATEKWASCTEYSQFELIPSEGYPMEYLLPGPVAPEQTQYGVDDWYRDFNPFPYGLGVWVENYTWDVTGYDNIVATYMVLTHHSDMGNPGVPLDGFVAGVLGDCDVASADHLDCHLDDLVYYDGHAIWCNDTETSFMYIYNTEAQADTVDIYTYQQNPDNPLPPDDPENIFYYYNYFTPDGIPDNDVDQNGVSDHYTVLAKVAGGDTLYNEDPETGIILFSEGMPPSYFEHTVADTTYLVVPRNLSYMWDSDDPASVDDDSGEPNISPACNGFIGWRLLDVSVKKADYTIERPIDVYGSPIPLSHSLWNWEHDPDTDPEKYDFLWGLDPYSAISQYSGPSYISDWVGNPCAPEAIDPLNPGPFPFVIDNPIAMAYPAFDYRFLLSFGPLDLEDGDTLYVTGGWVVGLGLDGLRMNADLLLDAYYRDSIWGCGLGIESTAGLSGEMLLSNYPNPFAGQTTINYSIASPGHISLSVFDISGRLVSNLVDTEMAAGEHSVVFDATSLNRGVYFYRLQTGGETVTRRCVLLR